MPRSQLVFIITHVYISKIHDILDQHYIPNKWDLLYTEMSLETAFTCILGTWNTCRYILGLGVIIPKLKVTVTFDPDGFLTHHQLTLTFHVF